MYISVIGAGECSAELAEVAYRLGREVARRGHVLVCGGLGGVMDAAARGACEEEGTTVGILPGPDRKGASRWLTVSVPTDMGHARNTVVARCADALIAVGGGHGTLSEIALGLKMGKPVVGIGSWGMPEGCEAGCWLVPATDPEEAVGLAEELAGCGRSQE